MNKKIELHVLSQIYDFLIEREGFTALNLHFKVMEFFRELHVGDKRDFVVLAPNKISGNFGEVTHIHLLNIPHFHEKDKFIHWAHKALNRQASHL